MSTALHSVSLVGDWTPLLHHLKGWKQHDARIWQGAGAVLSTHANTACATIQTADTVVSVFSDRAWTAAPSHRGERRHAEKLACPTLNHIALDIGLDGDDLVEIVARGESTIFLPRESRFDPSVGRNIIAEHVTNGHELYLTARFDEATSQTRLAHVGWELQRREDVDDVAAALQRIGWPIVYGPASVDESYLVHFRGPDGAVHDVFYVERQS